MTDCLILLPAVEVRLCLFGTAALIKPTAHPPDKSKVTPETALRGLEGSGRLRLPDF
jgi:hypothetical protein